MPISSPGSLRSPRSQALGMGTVPSGFTDLSAGYDTQAGVPSNVAGGHYQSAGPFVTTGGAPLNTPTPFALSGGGSK